MLMLFRRILFCIVRPITKFYDDLLQNKTLGFKMYPSFKLQYYQIVCWLKSLQCTFDVQNISSIN